jgi:serine/threonine protein kinase
VDARADLFAFGAMLYEALVGHVPHGDLRPDEFVGARLELPAPSLAERVPDLAPRVAAWIESLLAVDPAARPRSAAAALRSLTGELGDAGSLELPWLGTTTHIEDALRHVDAGDAVAFVGPPGAGKTRSLEELAGSLERRGALPLWLRPSHEPLGSLRHLMGDADEASLRAALATAQEVVTAALVDGRIFFADPWLGLDRWTRSVFELCALEPDWLARGGLAFAEREV